MDIKFGISFFVVVLLSASVIQCSGKVQDRLKGIAKNPGVQSAVISRLFLAGLFPNS
jgi:hypothetical protein